MPTYEFKCPQCGEKFTKMVSIAKKDEVRCPHCGSVPRQVFTSISIGCGGSCSSTGGLNFG